VFNAVERLTDFPLSGPQVQELNRFDLREILVGSFRIIYRVDSAQVTILTLRHSRQAPDIDELHGI
jgi:toxin ParE1/3/4